MVRWVTEHWKSRDLAWGNVFLSADVARVFVEEFRPPAQNLTFFSVGLNIRHVDLFLKEQRSPEKIVPSGIFLMIQKGTPPEAGGEPLGYELLGYELAWPHSWLCYEFYKDANERFGIRPNSHGFIGTFEDAEKVADLANHSDAPTENKPWLPWLVTVHSLEKKTHD